MRIALPAALTALLLAGGCGQGGGSGWNPVNWFSNAPRVETMEAAPPVPGDPRPRIDQIISLKLEPMAGGAILRATGLPPTQGYWEAALVRDESEEEAGRVVFDFLVIPPRTPQRVSTQPSREIIAAAYLTNRDLERTREFVVRAARNSASTRR